MLLCILIGVVIVCVIKFNAVVSGDALHAADNI